jgi:hypothetical protein
MYDAVGVHPDNGPPPGDTAVYPGGPTRTQEAQYAIDEMPKMGPMKMTMTQRLRSKLMAQSAASCAPEPIPQSIRDFMKSSKFMPHG